MANNRESRLLWILVALLLGFLLGWLVRGPKGGDGNPVPTPGPKPTDVVVATPTPTCVPLTSITPGVQSVLVGPSACDVKPECLTIKAGRDTVTWTTFNAPGKNLQIDFDAPVFSGMTQNGKSYSVPCSGARCTSNQINPVLPTPPAGYKEYKYSQTLIDPNNPSNSPCDGRIIIRW
jgi:hypothetical protein